MSTRATYDFPAQHTCLYIHHDGYEAGAAQYMYDAWQASTANSVTAESMIRGCPRAEITGSHDDHGDTQYRYTFGPAHQLHAETRDLNTDTWSLVFRGPWYEFVNQHTDNQLRVVTMQYGYTSVHTPASLKAVIDDKCRSLGMWASNHDTTSCNFKNLADEITALRSLITAYGEPAWKSEVTQ